MPSPQFAYFMLHGRARWLIGERAISKEQDRLIAQRPRGRWAIMTPIALDREACIYKMLEFRRWHVYYSIYRGEGTNTMLASYRKLAHDAKRTLGKSLIQLAEEAEAAAYEAELASMSRY